MVILIIHTHLYQNKYRNSRKDFAKYFIQVKYSVHAQLHSCKLQYQNVELVNMANSPNYISTCGLQKKVAKQASTHKESIMNTLNGCKMQEPLCCGKIW